MAILVRQPWPRLFRPKACASIAGGGGVRDDTPGENG